MLKKILEELKEHLPFTIFGAIIGIIIVIIFHRMPHEVSHTVFYILHPMHIIISALVTVSMLKLHAKRNYAPWVFLAVGYAGSVGIATISDSLIPYLGEVLLKMPRSEPHIGFIEKWWLVNPLALAGITIAYFAPSTKFPHAAHVLLSTSASLFHVLMAMDGPLDWFSCVVVFFFLFIAVWVPCCTSDIAFPLLFTGKAKKH